MIIHKKSHILIAGILLLCFYAVSTFAQVIPVENDTLNFRIAGFKVPPQPLARNYIFEVAFGRLTDEAEFEKHIISRVKSSEHTAVIELPSFGQEYTWRAVVTGKKAQNKPTLYHFITGNARYTDTSKYRLKVISNSGEYNDVLVLFDNAPIMYDLTGKLVWYIPDIPGIIGAGRGLRDLKPTPQGTFTLLNDYGAFEFDYRGKVLWRAPDKGIISGDSSEHYHHDFSRLGNGHYMVEGMQYMLRKIPANTDTTNFFTDKTMVKKDGDYYKTIDCATLIEYDSAGNILWNWKSFNVFTDSDYFAKKNPDGTLNSEPHINSFYFDELKNVIYLSLRNYSQILKIAYPSGKVLERYGMPLSQQSQESDKMLFRAQHCVRLTDDGNIVLFNNMTDRYNSREQGFNTYVSTIKILKEDHSSLIPLWEFPCNIDTFAIPCGQSGGSVSLLPDHSILACMGIAGRAFIVDPSKKVLWNALPQYNDDYNNQWLTSALYRTSYMQKKYLKKYIFYSTGH